MKKEVVFYGQGFSFLLYSIPFRFSTLFLKNILFFTPAMVKITTNTPTRTTHPSAVPPVAENKRVNAEQKTAQTARKAK
jgi:hypothetical protein